jgi:putative peptidoglycan lipid II flippase
MVVNLVGNLVLIVPLQHMGPPLATAIASTVNVGCSIAPAQARAFHPRCAPAPPRAAPGTGRPGHGRGALGRAGRADALCPWRLGLAHRRAGRLVRAGVVVYGIATLVWGPSRARLALLTRRRAAPPNK